MLSVTYASMASSRLEHACNRMNELMLACNQYLNSQPFCIERELYDLDSVPCVRFRYRVLRLPPLRLGLLMGEVVHQLRATLDNLVWACGQVYTSTNAKADNEKLAFPVAENEEKFKKILTYSNFIGIRDFPEIAQRAILEAQPFKRGLYDPDLQVLQNLWNVDKHRSPSLSLTHANGVSQNLGLQPPSFVSTGSIVDGLVFCSGALPPQGIAEGAVPQLHGVQLGVRDPLIQASYSLIPLLYGHIQLVNSVVNKMAPLLQVSPP